LADSNTIDSLKSLLPAISDNDRKVDIINEILYELINESDEGRSDSILKYQKMALGLAAINDYKKGKAYTYYILGKNEMNIHNHLDKATQNFLISISLYESINDSGGISSCHLQFGVISYELQNYKEAITSLRKSIQYSKRNTSLSAVAHYLTALSYSELNDIEQAIILFDSSLAEYKMIKDEWGVLNCNTFIGKMYSNAGDHNRAIQHLKVLIDNPKNDSLSLVPAFAFLSTAYLKNKDYSNAIKYGNLVIQLAGNLSGAILYLKEARNSLYLAYEKTGNTTKAFSHLSSLNDLKDSIYNSNTLHRIAEMKNKYEFEQEMKIQKIEQEKKEAIAMAETRRIETITFLVSIALGITAILLVALYRNFRLKQKTNKLLNAQNEIILKAQKRSDELLLNILPLQTATELKEKGSADPKSFESVTVLFSDFKNFTNISEQMSADELVKEINFYYSAFDRIIEKYNIEKIKTIGDSYMCAGGLPVESSSHPEDTILAALSIIDFVFNEKLKREELKQPFFEIRIGLHTGPVVAGIVGTKKFAYDIWGDTVNIASRMETAGDVGKVNISGSTFDLVKDKFLCTYRGKIMAKNKGEIDMYYVDDRS
jgi:class 3 adenylate cyclase/tetratricopeptide (TPR) repeat protein